MTTSQDLSGLLETIAQRTGKDAASMDLRIYQGQRIAYGTLASGEQRNELTAEQIGAIASTLQEPQTPGVDTATYSRKVPSLEIQVDYQTVFRQERDGVVSVNVLQPELEKQSVSNAVNPWQTIIAAEPEPVPVPEPIDTPAMVGVLENLVNPLSHSSESVRANLGGYEIQQEGDRLLVVKEGTTLLSAVDGQVKPLDMTQEEMLQPLREFATVQAIAQGLVDGHEWAQTLNPVPAPIDSVVPTTPATQTPDYPVTNYYRAVSVEPPQGGEPRAELPKVEVAATDPLQTLFDRLPAGNSRDFWVKLAGDLDQATKMAQQVGHAELRQVAKVTQQAAQAVRQVVGSEQFQATQQTVTQKLQEGLVWGTEQAGKGLETAGKWAQKAGQWLAARPEAIREQRAAATALSMFQKGYERTQERSYQSHGLRVSFQGRNTFTLSDVSGEMLLKFRAEKTLTGEPKLTVTEKGGLGRSHHGVLEAMRQDKGVVRGSPEAEAQHTQKSQQIGALARHLAAAIGTNSHEGKHYRIECEGDALRIIAKDGRGEVYRQQGESVISKLSQQDFAKFGQALQMDRVKARQDELDV